MKAFKSLWTASWLTRLAAAVSLLPVTLLSASRSLLPIFQSSQPAGKILGEL